MEKKRLPLNAVHLRYLALALMLLDHLWATVIPGNDWMTYLGRLAFPIFAFQAAEGYEHTSNFKQYCLRLLVFGLISEIPFNWMLGGRWFYPFHQNVMFTLLLGLLALRAADRMITAENWKMRLLSAISIPGFCLWGAVTFVDYGAYGVMMVLIFGLSRRLPCTKLFQLAAMVLINVVLMEGQMLMVFGRELPVQGFAVLALLPIWLYNGEKGRRSKGLQIGFYLFYPIHMAVLAAIRYFA